MVASIFNDDWFSELAEEFGLPFKRKNTNKQEKVKQIVEIIKHLRLVTGVQEIQEVAS